MATSARRARTSRRVRAAARGQGLAVVAAPPRAPILRLEEVEYGYRGGAPVLDSVSASIEEGEFVCIAGESGAGKTTLLKLMYGALPTSGGRIWVEGRPLHGARSRQLATVRRRCGFVFQDYALLPRLTALENVRFPLQATSVLMPFAEATRRANEALQSVGLGDRGHSFPAELSGGQQQRLAIARALVNRPRLLLADEPTGNLDEANARRVIDLLEAIAGRGTAVIVATHDPLVRSRARRRLILAGGRLLEDDRSGEVKWRGA